MIENYNGESLSPDAYLEFLESKFHFSKSCGFEIQDAEIEAEAPSLFDLEELRAAPERELEAVAA